MTIMFVGIILSMDNEWTGNEQWFIIRQADPIQNDTRVLCKCGFNSSAVDYLGQQQLKLPIGPYINHHRWIESTTILQCTQLFSR